jgi:hypothetical protein
MKLDQGGRGGGFGVWAHLALGVEERGFGRHEAVHDHKLLPAGGPRNVVDRSLLPERDVALELPVRRQEPVKGRDVSS